MTDTNQTPTMTSSELLAAFAELSARERWIISEMIRLILCDTTHTAPDQQAS